MRPDTMSQEQESVEHQQEYPSTETNPARPSLATAPAAAGRYWPIFYGGPINDIRLAFEAGARWALTKPQRYPQDAAVRMLMEHPNWDRKLRRASITPPTIRTIVHWRVEVWNTDSDGTVRNDPLHYRHVAVIVLPSGACYWAQATFPGSPYNRRIQRLRAVGRALKRCATDTPLGTRSRDPDFYIDCELTGRELYDAVRYAVAAAR